jgi:hypothetical protein
VHHAHPTATMAALALSLWVSGHADAATFERHVDPVMGCTMLLSGPIVEGDSERLQQFLERENPAGPGGSPGRLCLNSPGGSYREGVRLAQTILQSWTLGTAIAQGHRCESACAIAFMAGGLSGPEGAFRIRPIMHPQARLGFHAPSIDIPSGQYSEQQVSQAWNVALQAVAEIAAMRSGAGDAFGHYEFHELLFYHMLATPPDSMYFINTVERAARYDISVYPVGINSAEPIAAFYNLCRSTNFAIDGSMIHAAPASVPIMRSPAPDQAEAFFHSGFRAEGTYSCRAELSLNRLRERDFVVEGELDLSGEPQISIEFGGDERGRSEDALRSRAYTYMTFDLSTRLDQLPTDIEGTWREFIRRVQARATPAASFFGSCWLTSPTARITNVSEYVNLRRQPDFSAPLIRQIPLGERVRLQRADNITVIGQERNRQSCINACRSFRANREDRSARDRAQQCISDNIIWYEVTDARNNRGWVSRRYLEGTE